MSRLIITTRTERTLAPSIPLAKCVYCEVVANDRGIAERRIGLFLEPPPTAKPDTRPTVVFQRVPGEGSPDPRLIVVPVGDRYDHVSRRAHCRLEPFSDGYGLIYDDPGKPVRLLHGYTAEIPPAGVPIFIQPGDEFTFQDAPSPIVRFLRGRPNPIEHRGRGKYVIADKEITSTHKNVTNVLECLFEHAGRPSIAQQIAPWTAIYGANKGSASAGQRMEVLAVLASALRRDPDSREAFVAALDLLRRVDSLVYAEICSALATRERARLVSQERFLADELDRHVRRAKGLAIQMIARCRRLLGDVDGGGLIQTIEENCALTATLGTPWGREHLVVTGYRLRRN